MDLISNCIIAFVALLHFFFLILEMFLWTKPIGLKIFRQSLEKAKFTKVLASNQGLYNGFLSLGLIWSLFHPSAIFALQLKYFFLACVVAAGIFGALTVNKRIFWIQAFPAIVGILIIL